MIAISIFIPCVPPKTTSQQKGVMVIGGKPRFFTKAKVRQSADDMMTLLMPHAPSRPLEGPLKLTVTLTYPWRKTEKKRNLLKGWLPNDKKPDFDNLSKAICDVMTKLLFWKDDGQVYDGRIIKGWGDSPGIRIVVETDAEGGAQ
jgi:Holliday junction resolvase RusA-like endonuclease